VARGVQADGHRGELVLDDGEGGASSAGLAAR
jgi:hypothetical protein